MLTLLKFYIVEKHSFFMEGSYSSVQNLAVKYVQWFAQMACGQ